MRPMPGDTAVSLMELAQHMFILVNDVHDLVVLSTDGTSEILFLLKTIC